MGFTLDENNFHEKYYLQRSIFTAFGKIFKA